MDIKKGRLNTGYFFLGLFAFFIGLYPLRFIGLPYEDSLLGSKPQALLNSSIYLTAFYTHIFLGGLALLTGFSQFYKRLRVKRIGLHRTLGKIYVLSVLLSGISGLGIAFYATGGIIPALGFAGLAILWLYTTFNAYTSIKKGEVTNHQRWMIRSYALCFAAVTLRLYLPTFTGLLHMDFIPAYKIIAWLCWVPNILIAEIFIVRRLT
ncbi:DUF2306 domain-containing protein [uncultured Eudoraea sp.]|uniref:DUF2306 domain-containing protein n=1 Tax=uncultured Eudoraea sp. TaxID=1035614 RepID=UPI00261DBC16|nr:DUF2306 domain-containing protein [uncultured Eudoraea sp.]